MTTNQGTQTSWTDRIVAVMERMAPIFDQPHLASVRDGLAALTPLLIVGAFGLLITNFPKLTFEPGVNPGYIMDDFPDLAAKLGLFFNMTYAVLSLFGVVAIAYYLARRHSMEPLMPSLLALMTFLVFATPFSIAAAEGVTDPFGNPATGLPNFFFDVHGLFTAIILALVSVEVYRFFVDRNLVIRLPPQVPPSISQAFIALVPAIVLLVLGFIIRVLLGFDLGYWVNEGISKIIPAASSLAAEAFAETVHATLWTLGIHGDLTIQIVLQPIWTSNLADNVAAQQAGKPLPWIVADGWRSAYVVAGGSGCTLPLAFYMVRSKSARLRRVGWLGIWPGIFNINEPITFGTPVIFNPVLAIPFIVITLLNTIVAYAVHAAGLVPKTFILMPWTLPGPLLALLQTGFSIPAAILATFNEFVLPGVIWYPAFKAWERIVLKKEMEESAVGAAVPAAAD